MERNKLLIAFFAILLTVSPFATQPIGLHSVSAQQSFQNIPLELGYGPNSLIPISSGIPVFSYNDQMWIMSNYGVTLQVELGYENNYSTFVNVAAETIYSGSISPIYTFQEIVERNWTLYVTFGQNVSLSIPITYVNPSSIPAPSGNSYAYFSSGQLALNFSYSQLNSYNAQTCITGQNIPSSASVVFPSNFGRGEVKLTPYNNSDTVQLAASLGLSKPVIFWFELYHTYSYAQVNSTGLISTQIETSKSSPILISNGLTTNITVQNDVSLRQGRYVLRAFFDDNGNISVSETSILMLGAGFPWVWLGGCYPVSQNSPTSFSSQTSISEAPSSRPQNLYLMYDNQGVEFYKAFVIDVSIAKVAFTSLPFNAPFPNIDVSVMNNQEITSSELVNGTMYLMCSQFPVNVGFNFTFAGQTFATSQATIGNGTVTSINIPLSEITVKITNNGEAVSSAEAVLERGNSTLLTAPSNQQGVATFYVPAGNYNVSATYSGVSLSNNVITSVFQISNVSIPFFVSQVNQSPPDYLTPLVIILVIGILGNLWVWTWRVRRSRKYS